MNGRPTGIIRTLPSLYAEKKEVGHKRMIASLKMLEAEQLPAIYIAMSAMPKIDVLHMYLIIDGKIHVRMNIAGYQSGEDSEIRCWDDQYRKPKYWAICSAPVAYPPAEILRRGFQGFRYTEDLW